MATETAEIGGATGKARPSAPASFEFAVIAVDPGVRSAAAVADIADRLFRAGCDDATPGIQNGVVVIDFDREARNAAHAIASAINDVTRAGFTVIRVEPDPLVSAAEIARRCRVSRQAVHKWFRDDPSAPVPSAGASTTTPLYDWVDILRWRRAGRCDDGLRRQIVEARLRDWFSRAAARTSGRAPTPSGPPRTP